MLDEAFVSARGFNSGGDLWVEASAKRFHGEEPSIFIVISLAGSITLANVAAPL